MIFWLPAVSFMAASILAIASNWLDIKPLFQVSLTILILSYLSVLLSQTIILPIKFWTWRKHLVNPLGVIVDAVRKYAETDVQHGRASASYFPFYIWHWQYAAKMTYLRGHFASMDRKYYRYR
jgi:hypothetical protein